MKLVRSAAVLAAAVVVPLLPAAAQADATSHADAAGDVVSVTGNSTSTTPAPDRVAGDIVSSSIRHKRKNVVLRLQYRDLTPTSEIDGHFFRIRTSTMRRDVTLVASDSFPAGRVVMTKPNGKRVKDCHLARRIDYATNTATVVVPRSCLGRPKWVKVGMASIFFTGLGDADTEYVDDARTTGSLGSTPAYSPKVFR